MKKHFGLDTRLDGPYSKLIVANTAFLSFFFFGFVLCSQIFMVEWKIIYGIDYKWAGMMPTVSIAMRIATNIFAALFYNQFSPRKWVYLSSCMSLFAYSILYFSQWLPSEYFVYSTIIFGFFAGIAGGMGQTVASVAPYRWLKTTAATMGPLCFIGAPVGAFVVGPLTNWLIQMFSWPGAMLICIGLGAHKLISAQFFIDQPDAPPRQNNFSKIAPEKNIFVRLAILFRSNLSTMKKNPYFNRMLLLTVTTNAFVVTLIFSQVINIMNEFGLDRKMIAQIMMVEAAVDFLSRPFWGALAKFGMKPIDLLVLDSLLWIACGLTLSLSKTYWSFLLGHVFLGIAISGYGGFKQVLIIQLLGMENQPKYIVVDQLLCFPITLLAPPVSIYLGSLIGDLSFLFRLSCVGSFIFLGTILSIRKDIKAKENEKEEQELESS